MDADDSRRDGVSDAVRALLSGLVDYAGLFPPAALPMDEAVRNYAAYREGPHRGMLARFVLPVGRLEEFAAARGADLGAEARGAASAAEPWPLAVLAGAADVAVIAAFEAEHAALARVEVIEARADDVETIAGLADAYGSQRLVYVELAATPDPALLIAALAEHGLRAKIRTGGVTPEAFPAAADVLRFLARCVEHGVPFKATAGLHHPLRGEFPLTYAADAARGAMFGFVNVFLAAVFLHQGHAASAVAPLLEERDASAIDVTAHAVTWRGLSASAPAIAAVRARFAGSFGSCSFEEPVQDLRSLSLLPATV